MRYGVSFAGAREARARLGQLNIRPAPQKVVIKRGEVDD